MLIRLNQLQQSLQGLMALLAEILTTTTAAIEETNQRISQTKTGYFGTCNTAAATAEKTVGVTGFSLVTGAKITVKFTVTNKAANPTLNVNSTGAKPIFYRGYAVPAEALRANTTLDLVYNGAQWEVVGSLIWTTEPQPQNLTVDKNNITLEYDSSTETINATRLGDGAVTISAANYPSALNIVKTGDTTFTINQTGIVRDTDTLTVTVAATEEYQSGTAEINITLTAAPQPQNLTVDDDDITIEFNGSSIPLVFGRSGDGAITLTADNYSESISITKTNDTTFNVAQIGIVRSSTTLTATVAATEEYQSATKIIHVTLTAAPQPQTLTLNPNSLTLAYDEDSDTATINVTKLGSGAVTMTSDNTDVTVTKVSDAEFTVAQVTNASGTATLTATVAGTEEYQSATATVTVTLTKTGNSPQLTLTPNVVSNTTSTSATVNISALGSGAVKVTVVEVSKTKAMSIDGNAPLGGTVGAEFTLKDRTQLPISMSGYSSGIITAKLLVTVLSDGTYDEESVELNVTLKDNDAVW